MITIELFRSQFRGKDKVSKYPHQELVTCIEQLEQVCQYDHISARCKNNHRAREDFQSCNVIHMDLDNTHSEDSDSWLTLDDMAEAFPDVMFYYIKSRHYMKPKVKDGKTYEPREKYHIYFPLRHQVNGYDKAERLRSFICCMFPYFDQQCIDPVHFFYGVEDASGGLYEGSLYIDEYLNSLGSHVLEQAKLRVNEYNKLGYMPVVKLNDFLGIDNENATDSEGSKAPEVSGINASKIQNGERYFENLASLNNVQYVKAKNESSFEVECPWSDEHTDNDNKATVYVEPYGEYAGRLCFHCFHNHCAGRSWREYKDKVFKILPEQAQDEKRIEEGYQQHKSDKEQDILNDDFQSVRSVRSVRMSKYKYLNEMSGEFFEIENFVQGDASKLPEFNSEWLPYPFNEYCKYVAKSIQVATDMVGIALFTIVSSAVQKKYCVKVNEGYREPLNLYMVNIASPSERKSPVLKAIQQPLLDYQRKTNEKIKQENDFNKSRRELLKRDLSDAKKSGDDLKVKDLMARIEGAQDKDYVSLICSDITSEALADVMKENGEKTSIFSAEGGIFSTMAGLYSEGKSNIDLYLQAYSNEFVSIRRITRGAVELYHPALTMLLFVQPTIIQQIMGNEEFKGRGLIARFGYVFPKSIVGSRQLLFGNSIKSYSVEYSEALTEILSIPESDVPRDLILSDSAIETAEAFYQEIEKQIPESRELNFDDWMGKSFGQFLRILGLLHIMSAKNQSWMEPISQEETKIAVEVERYLLSHSKFAYSGLGQRGSKAEQKAKYILRKLIELLPDSIPDSPSESLIVPMQALWQKCKCKYDTREKLQEGIEELVLRNYIRVKAISRDSGGKATEQICVNPEIYKYIS